MRIGYTLVCSGNDRIEFRVFQPAGPAEARPPLISFGQDRKSETAAVLIGRLLYRYDIITQLPRSQEWTEASDAELALAVYRHAGRTGMERLEGEFSLALWDGVRRTVLAMRDPFGAWPLFWLADSHSVAVSTSLGRLTELLPSKSCNLDYLAEFLMKPFVSAEVACEQTVLKGIHRVLPGTIVEVGPAGYIGRHSYWDWESRIQDRSNTTLEEASQRFAHLFRQAVRERIQRGPVAAHLSGGMDSSSVVCVARDEMSEASRQRLFTLSLVYSRASLVGERAYIDMVARQGGPIEPHLLEADSVVDFDWFRQGIPVHDEPYGGLRGLAMQRLTVDAADQLGAVMTLTGLGSDEILDCQPYHIADLLRRWQWRAAVKEASQWARSCNVGLWSVLHRYGLTPLWPVATREGLRPFLRQGMGRWPKLGWFSIPPWVRPEFARKYELCQRGHEQARRMYASPTVVSMNRNMLETTAGDWSRWYLAAPRGLNISHPFRDPRLVSFALGIPQQVRAVPERMKPVLQEAMNGVLPEPIRTRQGKRGFDDIYGAGLAKNFPRLEQMVRDSAIRELGIFDVDRLVQAGRQATFGVGDVAACERLDRTLSLIAWFDQALHRPAIDAFRGHASHGGKSRMEERTELSAETFNNLAIQQKT